jgi:hypothetical protein
MDAKLFRLLVISVALVALSGLALSLGGTPPSYAGGPQGTPTCECVGGVSATPVANTSSIVGYVYEYTAGTPQGTKGIGVTLTGCSWTATWGTDDNGYFYFDNLGQGGAYVNLQLPPNGHAINPNVLVRTSGMTDTYTVYMGFYRGDTAPAGPFKTPGGFLLSGMSEPGGTLPPDNSAYGVQLPGVGGTFPDSYLVIGLSALLLLLLPVAGLARLTRGRLQP